MGSCALGANDVQPEDVINVYPNPANTKVNIQFKDASTHNCKLLNTMGQTVLEFNSNEINTTNIPNGIYFLKFDSVKNYTKKIIIKH